MTFVDCAYCHEPLNAGAVACKACGRRQPMSYEQKLVAVLIAFVVAGALGAYAYPTYDRWSRNRIALDECASIHAHYDVASVGMDCLPSDPAENGEFARLAARHRVVRDW
jgi:hypothetical protein